jgi:hypothetical protein
MSQAAAAADTQPPTFEMTVAIQMARKVGWRNTLQEDTRAVAALAADADGLGGDSLIEVSKLVVSFQGKGALECALQAIAVQRGLACSTSSSRGTRYCACGMHACPRWKVAEA